MNSGVIKLERLWINTAGIRQEFRFDWSNDRHHAVEIKPPFGAHQIAAAAMHLGKSSIEAVQVAIDLDSSCGNGIDSLTFG